MGLVGSLRLFVVSTHKISPTEIKSNEMIKFFIGRIAILAILELTQIFDVIY